MVVYTNREGFLFSNGEPFYYIFLFTCTQKHEQANKVKIPQPNSQQIYEAISWAVEELNKTNYSLQETRDNKIGVRIGVLKYLAELHKPVSEYLKEWNKKP